ncbi:MAG TPA: hypothetical protein P5556_10440 [Candidatus Gastranaerophilales bacterium]|nr:hypothetical protein [Candidatus Gastranaerophilales bacterium]
MNPEKMQFKGQLAEARKKYKSLDTEASGLIILIRSLLNPYEEDITKLETDKALQSMERLNFIKNQMHSLKTKIEKMEEDIE